MSLARTMLQHAMDSGACPVAEPVRARAVAALTEAGWKGAPKTKKSSSRKKARASQPGPTAQVPAPSSTSDEQLWAALLHNDPTAFAELWQRSAGALYGFASRQLAPTDAEAVLVTVFAHVFQQGDAWLGGHNSSRSSKRRGELVRQRLFRTARTMVMRHQARIANQELDAEALALLPEKDPDGPLRQLLGRETVEKIAAAANTSCRVIEQQVVAMVADGHTSEQVATTIGLDAERTRAVKYQALGKLRKALRGPKKRRR